jgi:hypothetical protein
MTDMRLALLAVLTCCLIVWAGCESSGKREEGHGSLPAAQKAQLDHKLLNATYATGSGDLKDEVTFVDGNFQSDFDRSTAGIGDIGYGDLNGDGKTDAGVVYWVNYGGSGSFFALTAVLDTSANPINVGHAPLGDRVVVGRIRLDRGTVLLDMVVHAEDDPQCCPSDTVVRRFRLDPLAGRLSPLP